MAKTAFLELLDSPKLISRKIWVTKNHKNYTPCMDYGSTWTLQIRFVRIALIEKNMKKNLVYKIGIKTAPGQTYENQTHQG